MFLLNNKTLHVIRFALLLAKCFEDLTQFNFPKKEAGRFLGTLFRGENSSYEKGMVVDKRHLN
jgi:hypothetical protein